ncbi:sensor histidine kinase [Calycomorphotria hydatis]|uniref:sensor histidine kinase n=1 Tax=Calycomorphotria hydatis TaxID=2528027 RepID=UPI0018D23FD1|nr:ATP-binding protein [Calycomorphotria hydatis]
MTQRPHFTTAAPLEQRLCELFPVTTTDDLCGKLADVLTEMENVQAAVIHAPGSEAATADPAVSFETASGEWRIELRLTNAELHSQVRQQVDGALPLITALCRQSEEFERRLLDEKLAAMAEFAAGAGHEINNPAATIAGRARLLMKDETDPERKRALATIAAQAFRIRDMIGDAMLFADPPQPNPEAVELNALVQEVLPPLRETAERVPAVISYEPTDEVTAFIDRTQAAVLLVSLLENAINAARESGSIQVAVRYVTKHDTSWASLTVTDDGHGFAPEDERHLFDPFYSGRQAGRGLGFGLSKCWRIVKMAGGDITASNRDKKTVFEVLLPTIR